MKIIKRNGSEAVFDITKLLRPSRRLTRSYPMPSA